MKSVTMSAILGMIETGEWKTKPHLIPLGHGFFTCLGWQRSDTGDGIVVATGFGYLDAYDKWVNNGDASR